MKKILASIGFGWTKWETIEENKPMIYEASNPFTGYSTGEINVRVDVLKRTNSMTGDVEFKNVKR